MDNLLVVVSGMNFYVVVVLLALIVFLVVKMLNKLGFLKDGTLIRIGVLLGTFLTSDMLGEAEQKVGGILIALLAVGFNELSTWVGAKVKS